MNTKKKQKSTKEKSANLTSSRTEERLNKAFPIIHVTRNDLEYAGFDTSQVDDGTMLELADKMNDSFNETGTYEMTLDIMAEHLEIPKRPENPTA